MNTRTRGKRVTPYQRNKNKDVQEALEIYNEGMAEGLTLLDIYMMRLPKRLKSRWSTYSGFWRAIKRMAAEVSRHGGGMD